MSVLSLLLYRDFIIAYFNCSGKTPVVKDWFIRAVNGPTISSAEAFITDVGISSQPDDLEFLRFFITWSTSEGQVGERIIVSLLIGVELIKLSIATDGSGCKLFATFMKKSLKVSAISFGFSIFFPSDFKTTFSGMFLLVLPVSLRTTSHIALDVLSA